MKTFLKLIALSFALFAFGSPGLSAQNPKQGRNTAAISTSIKLSVSPNPCQGDLYAYYTLDNQTQGIIEIIQRGKGAVIRIPVTGSGMQQINLSGLPTGIYYIRLVSPGASMGTRFMLR
jgi:hypothetical protein